MKTLGQKNIMLNFILWLLMASSLILTGGCGGPSRRVSAEPAISQIQAQAQQSKQQERLLMQMGRDTLSGYKDYKVGPEDLLEVTFFGNDELGREVRVNGIGEISLPLVGAVQVTGLSPQDVESKIAKLYKEGRIIRQPQISVSVKEFRHQRVMVTGAVANPGSYEVIGPRTLLEMLGKAGGLVDKPEMKAGDLVYVARNQNAPAMLKSGKATREQSADQETLVINLRRLLSGNALDLNITIKNGDVIYVPPAQMAFVLGAVKKPGQVAVRDNLTVTQAVALSEGLDPILSSNRITILRFDERGDRLTIPVNLKEVTSGGEPDPVLKPNDIVFVQESGVRRFFFDIRNLLPGNVGMGMTAF
jgi:polysaccharide export outer membrane protein